MMSSSYPLPRIMASCGHPACWLGMACVVLLLDYVTGPVILFPIMFVLPVFFAAWHRGVRWSIPFALILPFLRFGMTFFSENVPWTPWVSLANLLIRMAVLVSLAWLISQVGRQFTELDLEVKVLEGLLPICAKCKKIRDDQEQWHPLESYITSRSTVSFTHGFCPDCCNALQQEGLS